MQTARAQIFMQLEFFSFPAADLLAEEGAAIARLTEQIAKTGSLHPLLAMGRKALLHLHDGPGLAAQSSKLGSLCLTAQAPFLPSAHSFLGNVVLPRSFFFPKPFFQHQDPFVVMLAGVADYDALRAG